MNRTIPTLVVAAAALLLAACGGAGPGSTVGEGHGGTHSGEEMLAEPVAGAPVVEVHAVDIDFEPATIELRAGRPVNVTVVNDGKSVHDFTLEQAEVHVNVEPGDSKVTSMTIDEPGTYTAVCTVEGHEEAGMTIDVVVAE